MVKAAVKVKTPIVYGTVPRLWAGATLVCLATGPSLTQQDVDFVRDKAKVIAVKNAADLAPWADVIYAAGADRTRWWQHRGDAIVRHHHGLRFTLDVQARPWATLLKTGPLTGLSFRGDTLATGHHSGYQAINLAVLLGAARIVLLGYDMQATGGQHHFYGANEHGTHPQYAEWMPLFTTMIEPLRVAGIEIINASRETAISVFPKLSLAEALT